jgi:hypothetical protein
MKLLHLNRDWQKPMPTATQTATIQTAGRYKKHVAI